MCPGEWLGSIEGRSWLWFNVLRRSFDFKLNGTQLNWLHLKMTWTTRKAVLKITKSYMQ